MRDLESGKKALVKDESISDMYRAVHNYSIIATMLCCYDNQESDLETQTMEQLIKGFCECQSGAQTLFRRKNNDYGDAWKEIRVSSITDLMIAKIKRIKSHENQQTAASQRIQEYHDIAIYAILGLIRISTENQDDEYIASSYNEDWVKILDEDFYYVFSPPRNKAAQKKYLQYIIDCAIERADENTDIDCRIVEREHDSESNPKYYYVTDNNDVALLSVSANEEPFSVQYTQSLLKHFSK